ncbi:MAG: YceI family protein, partial [Candidatus Sumerlaeota bacterium]
MKSFRFILAGVLVSLSTFAMAQPAAAPAGKTADAKPAMAAASAPGTITWHATKTGGEHTGTFENWKFTKVDIPGGDVTKGTIELEIETGSLKVQPDKLQNHLKSPDFFDEAKFPTAKVTISNAKAAADKDGKKSYDADAKVEIHGVSATTKANFVVLSEKPMKIKGTAVLDRSQYKLSYDTQNPGKINAPVDITIEATLPESVAASAASAEAPKAASAGAPASATPVKGNMTTATK